MTLAKTTIRRKIYYRKAEFTSPQQRTLQQMTSEALHKNPFFDDRLEAVGSIAANFRGIGRYQEINDILCGHLLTFERGSYQTVVGERSGARECSLDAVTPPMIQDVQYQFVPGVLYFILFRNHVVVIQSAVVRTSTFEQHLAWLLRTKSNILNNKDGFVLKDEPHPATKDRIRKSHVKSVSLGRPLMTEYVEVETGSETLPINKTTKFQPHGPIVKLLKNMFADSVQFEKLGLENSVFDTNLEVWIEIRFPKRQRSKSEDSIRLLDNLGIALRDIDEDQAKLVLSDNSVVRGKDLKMFSEIDINVNLKGIPDEEKLFMDMRSWLQKQIQNSVIAPDL